MILPAKGGEEDGKGEESVLAGPNYVFGPVRYINQARRARAAPR